jgi:ABC-type Mn2+/Zn2+ transport system permease subunit
VLGLLFSLLADLPTGPSVVAVSSALVLCALVIRRIRRA